MPGRNRRVPAPSIHFSVLSALDDVVDQCQRMGEILLLDAETGRGARRRTSESRSVRGGLVFAVQNAVQALLRTVGRVDQV